MGMRLPWKRGPETVAYVDFPEDAELVTLGIGEKTYRDLTVIRTPDKVLNFRLALPDAREGTPVELTWTADGRGGEGEARIVRLTDATIGLRPTHVATGIQRRGSLRVPVTVPLTLNGAEGVSYTLNTRNISLGGALAVGRVPEAAPEETIPGRLDLPGNMVMVNAKVLPGEFDPPGVLRLRFVGLNAQAEDLIADYVATQERRRAVSR